MTVSLHCMVKLLCSESFVVLHVSDFTRETENTFLLVCWCLAYNKIIFKWSNQPTAMHYSFNKWYSPVFHYQCITLCIKLVPAKHFFTLTVTETRILSEVKGIMKDVSDSLHGQDKLSTFLKWVSMFPYSVT